MNLKNIIVHNFIKYSSNEKSKPGYTETSSIEDRKKELDASNEFVIKLASDVIKAYASKSTTKNYGTFQPNVSTYKYVGLLEAFINSSNSNFVDFTFKTAELIQEKADTERFASGGYLVFIRYEENYKGTDCDFLAVVMVKDKAGLMFNANLEPEENISINIDKLHQAVRINLTQYRSGNKNDSHLSFFSRGDTETSGYFRKALDCSDYIPSLSSTNNVYKAQKLFCTESGLDKTQLKDIKDDLSTMLKNALSSRNKSILLSDIVDMINNKVKAITGIEADFGKFISENNYEISNEFQPKESAIKRNTRIDHKEDDWNINFEVNSAKYADDDKRSANIVYDKNSNSLTFKNLPHKFKNAIISALDEITEEPEENDD
ncbi:nucleoid-associated protein [Pokkaliibacter sp. MBI-7]|uniref:nucleoid-associated protein n=1 Tax=Pokkaliibacter sp. MBI-7 TaxID=3040600 RepID=UPI00244D112E|nr:nucleoid-associated protein [Pokkaliibacter sp. MBI-7]MDH2435631.1 nucleoid-associated protein [Pokkaliibacter sp. MBI-7]